MILQSYYIFWFKVIRFDAAVEADDWEEGSCEIFAVKILYFTFAGSHGHKGVCEFEEVAFGEIENGDEGFV